MEYGKEKIAHTNTYVKFEVNAFRKLIECVYEPYDISEDNNKFNKKKFILVSLTLSAQPTISYSLFITL